MADLVGRPESRKVRSHLRQKPIAPKAEFIEAFQSDSICPVLLEKISRFARRANHLYKPAPSCLTRGAARDRHGRRDRMRWTRRGRKTNRAFARRSLLAATGGGDGEAGCPCPPHGATTSR